MKRLTIYLLLAVLSAASRFVSAEITTKENPRFMTRDSIDYQIREILRIDANDHSEALALTFGLFSDIQQDTLTSMISDEFVSISNSLNRGFSKVLEDNTIDRIDRDDESIKQIGSSIDKIRNYERFFLLLVEVGAVPAGLPYLDQVVSKHFEMIQIQQKMSGDQVDNAFVYKSRGAELMSDRVLEMLVPGQRRILDTLRRTSDDPVIADFVRSKNAQMASMPILREE